VNAQLAALASGILLALTTAATPALESVRLIGIAGRTDSNAPLPAVFSNREEKLDLEIDAPAVSSAALRADLFQVTGELAMPLDRNRVLTEGLVFPTASLQHLRIAVKFPEVKRCAVILLRLSLKNATAMPVALGELRFEVFPASVTKELLDLLRPRPGGPSAVTIFGPGQLLRNFLTDSHVSFDEGGTDVPGQLDPVRLYFGEWPASGDSSPPLQDPAEPGRIAVFGPDDSVPPGVYVERSSPAGPLVRVTLPFLQNLKEDPRSQLALIKVIHLLSAFPSSSTN
jgi:hypothetical protein